MNGMRKELLLRLINEGEDYHGRIEAILEDEKTIKDKGLMLRLVNENGNWLEYASDELKKDKDVVLAALKKGGRFVPLFVDKEIYKDKSVLLEALEYNTDVMDTEVGIWYCNDREVVKCFLKNSIEQCSINYFTHWIDEKLLYSDKELLLLTLEYAGMASENIEEDIKKIPAELLNDYDIAYKLVYIDGYNLQYLSKTMRNNEKIVEEALSNCPSAIQFIDDEDMQRKFALDVVSEDGELLDYLCDSLKEDLDIVKAAIKSNPRAIMCTTERVRELIKSKLNNKKSNGNNGQGSR